MTYQQFYTRLTAAVRKLHQKYHTLNQAQVRNDKPNPNEPWLVVDHGNSDKRFCPITAVYTAETGKYIFPAHWRSAAAALGIPKDLATSIAHAADNEDRVRRRANLAAAVRRGLAA